MPPSAHQFGGNDVLLPGFLPKGSQGRRHSIAVAPSVQAAQLAFASMPKPVELLPDRRASLPGTMLDLDWGTGASSPDALSEALSLSDINFLTGMPLQSPQPLSAGAHMGGMPWNMSARSSYDPGVMMFSQRQALPQTMPFMPSPPLLSPGLYPGARGGGVNGKTARKKMQASRHLTCNNCKTNVTPLWRRSPDRLHILCNAWYALSFLI